MTGKSEQECYLSPRSPSLPSLFDDISTEIIQLIFSDICPSITIERDNSPSNFKSTVHVRDVLDLAIVCKRWNDIIMTNQAMWATLDIEAAAFSDSSGVWRNRHLSRSRLQKCIEMTGGTHALDISIYDHIYEQTVGEGTSEVLGYIMPHSERWRNIHFGVVLQDDLLRKLDQVKDRLPLLQCIRLRQPYTSITDAQYAAFQNSPSLNAIHMEHVDTSESSESIRNIKFPWSQISKVILSHCFFKDASHLDDMFSQLQHSTTELTLSLVSCSWYILSCPIRPNIFTMVNLQKVDIGDGGILGLAVWPLFDRLTCPSLKRLEVRVGDLTRDPPAILEFVRRSSCALTDLGLFCRWASDENIILILQSSSLATLTSLSLEIKSLTKSIVAALVLDPDHALSFPFLKSLNLKIKADIQDVDELAEQIERLEKIITSRTRAIESDSSMLAVGTNTTDSENLFKNCSFMFSIHRWINDQMLAEQLGRLRSLGLERKVQILIEQDWAETSDDFSDGEDIFS